MRKAAAIIIPVLLFGLLSAQFLSCERYVLPSLEVSPDTIRFTAEGGKLPLVVKTNVVTVAKAEDKDFWYAVDPGWMDADIELSVLALENTDTTARSAVLSVKSEVLMRSVVILQEGAEAPPEEPEEPEGQD